MSDDMFPEITAYLVGGPADGREARVTAAWTVVQWAEVVPLPAYWKDHVSPDSPSMIIHEYRECRETGEWLWTGVKR